MILLVDIGNTNIVLGFAENEGIIEKYRIKSSLNKTADEYYVLLKPILDNYKIENAIVSSVVPVITSALKKGFKKNI